MTARTMTIIAAAILAIAQPVDSQTLSPTGGATPLKGAGVHSLPLTLAEAVSRALGNAPLVQSEEAAVAAARAGVGRALSSYYPNISASAGYTRIEPSQSFTFPGLGTFSLNQEDNWDFHLGLSENLLAFGRRRTGVQLAEVAVSSGEASLEGVRLQIAYQVAAGFHAVLFLRDEIDSLDQQLRDLDAHLRAIRKKEQTGSATRYDVLKTEVRAASMESRRVDAVNAYMKQMLLLSTLVGAGPTDDVTLVGTLAPGKLSGDTNSFTVEALAERPDVRQALETVRSAELNRRLVGLSVLPSLSTAAEVGYRNGLYPNTGALTFTWNAGVTLSVPVFDGLGGKYAIDGAELRVEEAEGRLAQVRRNARIEVLQAFQDYAAGREIEEVSQVGLNQAREALDAARIQYNLGVIANTEYLDAQSALEQAKLRNLEAIYRTVKGEYELKRAMGERIW